VQHTEHAKIHLLTWADYQTFVLDGMGLGESRSQEGEEAYLVQRVVGVSWAV